MNNQAYASGRVLLELNSRITGSISEVAMSEMKADEIKHQVGGDGLASYSLGKVSTGDVTIKAGFGNLGRDAWAWIQSSFRNEHLTKDFAIVVLNNANQAVERYDYYGGVITKFGLNDLGPTEGTKNLELTLTISVSKFIYSQGKKEKISADLFNTDQQLYRCDRVTFDLPFGASIQKMSGFSFESKAKEVYNGQSPDPIKFATGSMVAPQINVTVTSASAAQMNQAAISFMNGQQGAANEFNGGVTLTGPDGGGDLLRFDLYNMGFKSFKPGTFTAGSDNLATKDFGLYVRNCTLTVR